MQTAYDNFDKSVRTYLAKTFNSLGLQYSHSQIFGVIFDGVKGVMQNMMFYIEDALTEQNIFKATRKTSVYSLAKISGYEAYYGSAASGNVIAKTRLTNGINSIVSSKIYIQHGTVIQNEITGTVYSINLPSDYYVIDISKPLLSHSFNIVQGQFVVNKYVSKGYNLETIRISSLELFDKDYITVKVDGEIWKQASCLYDMTYESKEYVVNLGFDNAFDVMFGNDIHGKKLKEGQTITIEYLKHGGITGNIMPDEQSLFKFVTKLQDSVGTALNGNNYISLTISNSVSGGTNSDSVEFIRRMVGMNSRSLVLASEDNFKLFFKRFSFIGYVNCWSENNSMIVTATCLKNIKNEIKTYKDYFNLKKENLLLSTNEKTMIKETLKNSKKSFAGITLKFVDPIIRRFALICYVKADNKFNEGIISDNIKKALSNYFINLKDDTQFIPKSDLINTCLQNVENLKGIEIDIISELAEETYKNNYYEKYELEYINGTYEYVSKRVMYEKESTPGLDNYGNILLHSKLEIPYLQGGFRYYNDKENYNKKDFVNIETIQILFI